MIKKILIILYALFFIVFGTLGLINNYNIRKNMTPRELLIEKCEKDCSRFIGKDYLCIEKCIELNGQIK